MNYALFAESKHLVSKQLNKIINDLEKQYDCDTISFDGNNPDFNVEQLINELNTVSFLSEHKIIVLENPYFLGSKGNLDDCQYDLFKSYLDNPAEFSTLIFYVNQFKIDKRKKISKLIIKACELFEPKALDDYEISRIIGDDLKKLNISIEHSAKVELDKRIAYNFDNWENELIKLELYNKSHLKLLDIELLISENSLDNVFDLVNSVINKDLGQSLYVYRNLEKSASEPIAMIMLLANQFRLIFQVKTLLEARVAYNDIAKHLKVHPYRVKLAREIADRSSSQKILNVLNKLATLEQNIKLGFINPDIGFELFLIEVSK